MNCSYCKHCSELEELYGRQKESADDETKRRLVVIESPYAADHVNKTGVSDHERYGRRAMADSIARDEAPYASHLLYTQDGVLNDRYEDERQCGIRSGFAWGEKADLRVFYIDYGMSDGMCAGMQEAFRLRQPIEFRRIGRNETAE